MTDLERRVRRLEDLDAIRQLDATYCRLLDAADWPGLAELFTPEGQFVGLRTAHGRDGLIAFFSGLAGAGLTRFWHHVTNLEMEVVDDRARVRSLLWQPCVRDGLAQVAVGRYDDALVRHEDGRWRYERKRVVFDFFVPLDRGWAGVFSAG